MAVDEPGQEPTGGNHRDGVEGGNHDGHAQIGVDECARCLVAIAEVGGPAEPEIRGGTVIRLREVDGT
jgi:hypothetical protein